MIEFRVHEHHITLLPDTTVQMELVNPLFADGIEDSFSLPIDMPVRGNEVALAHVHQVANKLRTIDFQDVRMEVDGAPSFSGDLRVQGSDDSIVSATFGIDALAVRIKGRKLPELLSGPALEIEQADGIGHPPGHRAGYAFGGDCQFPMHFNPSLYGDANKDWFPSTQEWDATVLYSVNTLVTFTTYSWESDHPVERSTPWQCIVPSLAGQSPLTHPAKWKKTAYGIVNAWDHAANDFKFNTTDGNFYTLVPWFYTKWVLKKAMAAIGYAAIGDFMGDARTDEVLVPNSTTIDVPVAPTTNYYFKASDTSVVNYGSDPETWDAFRVHGADDSTINGDQDPDNIWDTTDHVFTCPASGDWVFKVLTTMTNGVNLDFAWTGGILKTRLCRADGTVIANVNTQFSYAPLLFEGDITYRVRRTSCYVPYTFEAGDIGEEFHFRTAVQQNDEIDYWPATEYDSYRACEVTGWISDADQAVCYPGTAITPARHVPNVEVSEWLVGLAAAFNLSITPDTATSTIRFDYKENTTLEMTQGVADETPRLAGPIALDHQRRTLGMRLKWGLDGLSTETVQANEVLQTFVSEKEVPIPHIAGLRCLLLNTRELLKSQFKNGDFYWKSTGYYVPDKVVGDPDNAEEVAPAMQPLHMERHSIDYRDLIIPVFDAAGTSDFFHTEGDRTRMAMCVFTPTTIGPATTFGDGVPTLEIQGPQARSWAYAWHDYEPVPLALEWFLDNSDPLYTEAITPYTEFFKRWMDTMVNSEPVTMDLRMDQPFILKKGWHKPILLDYQRYLVQRMPITYTNTLGNVIAEQVQALRLREGVPDFVAPNYLSPDPIAPVVVFTPAGFNNSVQQIRILSTGHVLVAGAFTASGSTPLGRVAKLNPDGGLNDVFTFNSGTGFNDQVYGMALQPDGKILICGAFTSYNGTSVGGICRLNTNGTIDTTFNVGGSGLNITSSFYARDVVIMTSGVIVVGGLFTFYNGLTKKSLVALDPDGQVSTTLITGIGMNNAVQKMVEDGAGNLLVAGIFSTYKAAACTPIIRIQPDGTRDTTLVIATITFNLFSAYIQDIKVQPNGSILITGSITKYNGVTLPSYLLRISSTGAMDTAFNSNLSAITPINTGASMRDIAIAPDGRIFNCGDYFRVDNADGTPFANSYLAGFSGRLMDIAFNADGSKATVVGFFTTVNGVAALRIFQFDI